MPALSSRTKSKALFFATMLAPVLIVQLTRSVLDTSPVATASASTQSTDLTRPLPAANAKPLDEAQRKALAWIVTQPSTLPLRSPMDRPDPAPIILPQEVTSTQPEPAPTPAAEKPTPTFKLTGMIATVALDHTEKALASINHRIYRVGDEVISGWTVTLIDSRQRIVTLVGPDGRSVTLTQPQPAPDR